MTELDINSSRGNHPVYLFWFAQVRIVASSLINSLTLVNRWPKILLKDVDSAKPIVSDTKAAKLVINLGPKTTHPRRPTSSAEHESTNISQLTSSHMSEQHVAAHISIGLSFHHCTPPSLRRLVQILQSVVFS